MGENTLKLDARRRAMLDEMGVKVWWPAATRVDGVVAAAVKVDVVPAAERPAAAAPVRSAAVAPAPVAVAPRPATAPQGATVLAEAPRRIDEVDGGGAALREGWLIVADMPPEHDGRHGEPFEGDAGRLLDNMLRALQLRGGGLAVNLMRTHRGVASGQPRSPRPVDDALAEAMAELAPRVVLAMGPLAAQHLLQSGEPLGKLRGRAVARVLGAGLPEVPVIATYHPGYLLRNPADKARAWADLCLAADQLPRSR